MQPFIIAEGKAYHFYLSSGQSIAMYVTRTQPETDSHPEVRGPQLHGVSIESSSTEVGNDTAVLRSEIVAVERLSDVDVPEDAIPDAEGGSP